MSPRQRRVPMVIVTALIMALLPAITYAQDDQPVRAVGSGLAAPILEGLAAASGTAVTVEVSGSTAGVSSFCAGEADIALTTRPLSADEEAACNANQVNFYEFLLGSSILAVVGNPADRLPECLAADALTRVFAPSATANNWNVVIEADAPDLALQAFVPASNTAAYALLDTIIGGAGLRDNGVTTGTSEEILAAVKTTPGAIGIVSLGATPDPDVRIFELDNGILGCTAATAENVEARLYPASNRLFAYVDAARVDAVRPLFDSAFADGAIAGLNVIDVVPPTQNAIEQNRAILADAQIGRQFTREVTAFQLPDTLVGTISIAGTTEGSDYIEAVTGAFVTLYPGVTTTFLPQGAVSGATRFCLGEVDAFTTFTPLSDEQLAACAAANITAETFDLGQQVVLLYANADLDFATCLTVDEVATLWGATDSGVVTNWNQVRADFPDQPITLFGPTNGSVYRDLLVLNSSGETPVAPRAFTDGNDDPAYRIAATANVAGAMTFLSYPDSLITPENELARVQPVAVDNGEGCVTPSETTYQDQTYALSRDIQLIVSRAALARQDMQSLLWFAATDVNYPLLSQSGLVGAPFSGLASLRERLETLFAEAQAEIAAATIAAAEATAQPDAESAEPAAETTPEVTPETTPEGTGS